MAISVDENDDFQGKLFSYDLGDGVIPGHASKLSFCDWLFTVNQSQSRRFSRNPQDASGKASCFRETTVASSLLLFFFASSHFVCVKRSDVDVLQV